MRGTRHIKFRHNRGGQRLIPGSALVSQLNPMVITLKTRLIRLLPTKSITVSFLLKLAAIR